MNNKLKYWNWTWLFFAVFPFSYAVSILSFYFHAKHILGRFPSYNNPDPKELEIYSTYSPFIDVTSLIWLRSFLLWIVLAVIYCIIYRNENKLIFLLVGCTGQLLAILILISEIETWYID